MMIQAIYLIPASVTDSTNSWLNFAPLFVLILLSLNLFVNMYFVGKGILKPELSTEAKEEI